MKMSPYERKGTKSRFEKGTKGKSQMACFILSCAFPTHYQINHTVKMIVAKIAGNQVHVYGTHMRAAALHQTPHRWIASLEDSLFAAHACDSKATLLAGYCWNVYPNPKYCPCPCPLQFSRMGSSCNATLLCGVKCHTTALTSCNGSKLLPVIIKTQECCFLAF